MDVNTAIQAAQRRVSAAATSADACTAKSNWPSMLADARRTRDALVWLRDHPAELPPVQFRYDIVCSGICPAVTLALIAKDDESSQDTLSHVIRAAPELRGVVADTLSRRWGYTPDIIAVWRNA